jgi:hypothetical protein
MAADQQQKQTREYILECSKFFESSQRITDNYEDEYRALGVRYHSTELAAREGLESRISTRLCKAPFELTTEAEYNAHMCPPVAWVLVFGAPSDHVNETEFNDVDRFCHVSEHEFNREYAIDIQQVLAKARDEARPNDSHPKEIARRARKCHEYRDVVRRYMKAHQERTEKLTNFIEELEVHQREVLGVNANAAEHRGDDYNHNVRRGSAGRFLDVVPGMEALNSMMNDYEEYKHLVAWVGCLPETRRAVRAGRALHEIAIGMLCAQGAREHFVDRLG